MADLANIVPKKNAGLELWSDDSVQCSYRISRDDYTVKLDMRGYKPEEERAFFASDGWKRFVAMLIVHSAKPKAERGETGGGDVSIDAMKLMRDDPGFVDFVSKMMQRKVVIGDGITQFTLDPKELEKWRGQYLESRKAKA